MIDLFKNLFWYIIGRVCIVLLYMLKYFPVPQGTYDEAVRRETHSLADVSDCFKTQEICNEAVCNKPYMIYFVPDHFWMQEMCNEIMRTMLDAFHHIPDCLKTQEMCEKVVKDDPSLQYVPDWFVTQQQIDTWYDDDVELIEWYNDYHR